MRPPSITAQRQAVEILLAASEERMLGGATNEAASQTVTTLRWIENNEDLVRAIAKLMRLFPGAEIGSAA